MLISYFHHKFQVKTPEAAWTEYKFSAQAPFESLETWGSRLDRLVVRVQRFDMTVTWSSYLTKWRTGTRQGDSTKSLQDSLLPRDPDTTPTITDYFSFRLWRQRYMDRVLDFHKMSGQWSSLLAIVK